MKMNMVMRNMTNLKEKTTKKVDKLNMKKAKITSKEVKETSKTQLNNSQKAGYHNFQFKMARIPQCKWVTN